jgi:hypothetical protein
VFSVLADQNIDLVNTTALVLAVVIAVAAVASLLLRRPRAAQPVRRPA